MEQLLSTSEASRTLNICMEGTRRLIRRGELEASLVGGVYRIKPSALEQLVERRSNQPRQK